MHVQLEMTGISLGVHRKLLTKLIFRGAGRTLEESEIEERRALSLSLFRIDLILHPERQIRLKIYGNLGMQSLTPISSYFFLPLLLLLLLFCSHLHPYINIHIYIYIHTYTQIHIYTHSTSLALNRHLTFCDCFPSNQ